MFFDRDVSFSSEQSKVVSPCEREIFTSKERFVEKAGLGDIRAKKLPFPGSVLYITPRKSYFHIP